MATQLSIQFPILDTARYLTTVERAKDQVKSRLQPPQFEQFKAGVVSEYPRWFFAAILTALAIVLLLSFVISAGKQAAAAGMLFDHLPSSFSRLSPEWASFSVASMLLLSEIGAVLFLIGTGTLARNAPKTAIGGRQVNLTALLFRLFAVLCAGYAILSNVTVTALDPVPQAAVLQWAVAVGIPSIVLGLGVMLERLMIDAMKARNAQRTAYEKAVSDYQAVVTDPTKHPAYPAILADCIYTGICGIRRGRDLVQPLVEGDPSAKRWIVASEYHAQQEATQFALEMRQPDFLPSAGTQ